MRRRYQLGLGLLLIVALVAVMAARHRASEQGDRNVTKPSITIEASALDFGEVWETDQFAWKVPVRNPSSEAVRVTVASESCGCVDSTTSDMIPAGETRFIAVKLDLRNMCGLSALQHVREFKTDVNFVAEDKQGRRVVPAVIRGRVKAALRLSTLSVDLGRSWVKAPPRPRVVPARFLMDLSSVSVSVEGHGLAAEFKPAPDNRGGEVVIQRLPGLAIARYSGTVSVQPTAPREIIPPIRLPVTFELLGDVQPDAPVVVLGPGTVGEVLQGRLTLTSYSGRPFRVTTWTASEPKGLEVVPDEKGGAAYGATIRQRVGTQGNGINRLTFTGEGPDGERFDLTVEVLYYGLNP